MATSNLDFGAQIDAWVRQTEARTLAVLRESTQRVVSQAQSRIPIDTGFARASVRASLSAMPPINPNARGQKGASYGYSGGEVATVIAQAKLGDTIYIGWTAAYVGFLENGHSKKAPSGFVGISAMEWPRIVREVTAEAKSRVGVG
jgi:hypothetical protein